MKGKTEQKGICVSCVHNKKCGIQKKAKSTDFLACVHFRQFLEDTKAKI